MNPEPTDGLLAVLEGWVECGRCGTPTTPHQTGEHLCGPCWRHLSYRTERVEQKAQSAGLEQARRSALERTDQ